MTYNPKAAKSSLGNFMRPMGKTLYPPSDITSYVTDTSAPSYSGQTVIYFNAGDASDRFRVSGLLTDIGGNGINAINGATQSIAANWTSYEVEFYVSGDRFTIWTVNAVDTDYRLYVDDMPLDLTWKHFGGSQASYYIKTQFASSRVRKIRALFGANSLTGIAFPGTSAIWAAPPRFKCAITGDSYILANHSTTEGTISAGSLGGELAIATGWEVWNLGQGGTGYVNNGGGIAGVSEYGSSSRLSALAALPELDLIIAYGSGNDSGTATGTVLTAANLFWDTVHAARPSTPIVVAGVEAGSPTGFDTGLLDTLNDALIPSAEASSSVAGVIDMRTDPWVTGTGKVGTPAHDGNADFIISSDGVHPSHLGFQDMADRMTTAFQQIKV